MEFRLLGLLEVEDEQGPVRIAPGRESALLALLLLHAGEPLSTDKIVDDLWEGGPPEHAGKSVQIYVSRLRKALGAARIETTPGGYRIRTEPGELDIERFDRLGRAGQVDDALALWRGEPLADFRYAAFAQTEARRLEELRRSLLAERIDEHLAHGEGARLVPELEAAVAAEPLVERTRAQLMHALYLAGRQAEALELYRATRALFAEELGVEPAPELQRLERAILNHDRELGAPQSRRAVRGKHGRRLLLVGGLLVVAAALSAAIALSLRHASGLASVEPGSIAVIDARSDRLVGQISVGDRPSRLAVAGTTLWALNAGDGTISQVDTATARTAPAFGPSLAPSDLAATAGAVWVGDAPRGAGQGAGLVARFDPVRHTRTGSTSLPGSPVPGGGRPAEERYLVAGGGNVFAIGPDLAPVELDGRTGAILRTIGGVAASSIAYGNGALWAVSGRDVVRIDVRNGDTRRIPVSSLFDLGGIAAGGGLVWATSFADGLVWRIDPGAAAHASTISVGYGVSTIAYGDGAVWTGNGFDGSIDRIDGRTSEVRRVATVPAPQDIATGRGRVYVAAGTPARARGIASSACGRPIGGGDRIVVSDLPLQGSEADTARSAVATAEAVLRLHSYRAGRYHLAFQSCDDSSSAAGGFDGGQCLANAAAYAGDLSVVGVIGPADSACALEQIPVANRAPHGPLAMVSPFTTGPFLTRPGLGDAARTLDEFYAGGPRNYVRTIGADHIQVAADALFARRLGARRVAVVFNRDGMIQQMQERWFVRVARRIGLTTMPILWNGRQSALALAVRRSRADAAFVVSFAAGDPRQAHDTATTLGRMLPGRPVIVTDGFAPAAVVAGSRAMFYASFAGVARAAELEPADRRIYRALTAHERIPWAVAQTAAATRALLAAIAASDGTRRSVVIHLHRRFDRWGDPPTAPVGIYRLVPGAANKTGLAQLDGERWVATITPPVADVPSG